MLDILPNISQQMSFVLVGGIGRSFFSFCSFYQSNNVYKSTPWNVWWNFDLSGGGFFQYFIARLYLICIRRQNISLEFVTLRASDNTVNA